MTAVDTNGLGAYYILKVVLVQVKYFMSHDSFELHKKCTYVHTHEIEKTLRCFAAAGVVLDSHTTWCILFCQCVWSTGGKK